MKRIIAFVLLTLMTTAVFPHGSKKISELTATTGIHAESLLEISAKSGAIFVSRKMNWQQVLQFLSADSSYFTYTPTTGTSLRLGIGVVNRWNMASNSITSTHIVNGTVALADLASNSVDSTKIAANSISSGDIAVNAITAAHIGAGQVGSSEIGSGVVGSNELAANSVDSTKIAANSISSGDIAVNAITAAHIGAGQVGSSEIGSGVVGSDELAANSVDSTKIAANSISSGDIAVNAITAAHIATGAVSTGELVDGGVNLADLASNSVDSTKIVGNSISSGDIAVNAITAAHIAAGQVGASEIATDAVGSDEIAVGAVGTSEIADGSVSLIDMAANSIDSTKIVANSVSASDIQTNAIGSGHIAPGAVGTSDIADGSVNLIDMAANSIDSTKIVANSVSASDIQTNAIWSGHIAPGAVGTSDIADGSVNLVDMAANSIDSTKIATGTISPSDLSAYALDRIGKTITVDNVFDYDSTTHVVKWAAGLVYGIKTNGGYRSISRANTPRTISDSYGCIFVHADSLIAGTDSLKVLYNANVNAVTAAYNNSHRYVILAWRQLTRHSCPYMRGIKGKINYGDITQEAIDKLSASPAILKVFDFDSTTHVLSWPTFFMPGLKFAGSVNRWVSTTGNPMTLSGTYSLAYLHADSLIETDKLKVLYDSNWMDNTLAWFNNHKIQVIAIRSDANHSCIYQREKDYDALLEDVTHSGESIVWFGTSIPTTGYPQLVGTALNMTIYNEAQGSSMVRSSKDTGSMVGMQYANVIYSLSHTDAEKDSIIAHWSAHLNSDGTFNWAGSYGWRDLLIGSPPSSLDAPTQALIIAASYENKLKKKYLKTTDPAFVCWPDYYVFDHGHNDLAVAGYDTSEATAITVPTWNRDTRAKFIGAMTFLLDTIFYYNPRARVALIGHYEGQKVTAIYKAQDNLAEAWNLPICRLWEKLGWSQQTVTTTGYWSSGTWHDSGGSPQSMTMTEIWMEDDLHPSSTAAKQLIANVITQWFRTIF